MNIYVYVERDGESDTDGPTDIHTYRQTDKQTYSNRQIDYERCKWNNVRQEEISMKTDELEEKNIDSLAT